MHILWISTLFDDNAVSNILLTLLPHFPKSYTFTAVSIGSIEHSQALQGLKQLGVSHISLHCKKYQICKMVLKINALVKKIAPDVIHAQLGISLVATLLSKNVGKMAKLASFHNTAEYFNSFTICALKLFFRRFDAISAVSCNALESIQQKFDTSKQIPSRVIYNPVLPCTREYATPKTLHIPIQLLVATRLDHQKGHELWIHMASTLKKIIRYQDIRHPDTSHILQFQLRCIGRGTLYEALLQQCKTLGVETEVEFLGHQDDVYAYIQDADIVLSPSQNEGFGLVPCEALINGTPVIVHDIPVMHEILTDSSWFVDCNDAVAFSQKVLDVIKNYSHYSTRARVVGQILQKKFSPAHITDAYRQFYEMYGHI